MPRERTRLAATRPPRRTACSMSRSMHQTKGPDHRTTVAVAGRQEIGDYLERFGLRAAVGFDERARRCAEPRAPDRIGDQRQQRFVELLFGAHLDRRVVADERVGDLTEVVHVWAEDDRLAEDR